MPWDLSNTSRGISRGTSAKQTLQDMSASAVGDLGDVGATGSRPIPTFGDSPAAARAETPPPNPRRRLGFQVSSYNPPAMFKVGNEFMGTTLPRVGHAQTSA